jgi:hypothetical protein
MQLAQRYTTHDAGEVRLGYRCAYFERPNPILAAGQKRNHDRGATGPQRALGCIWILVISCRLLSLDEPSACLFWIDVVFR